MSEDDQKIYSNIKATNEIQIFDNNGDVYIDKLYVQVTENIDIYSIGSISTSVRDGQEFNKLPSKGELVRFKELEQ